MHTLRSHLANVTRPMPKHPFQHRREARERLPLGLTPAYFEPQIKHLKRHRRPQSNEAPGEMRLVYLPGESIYPYGGEIVPLDIFLGGDFSWGCVRNIFLRYEDLYPIPVYPEGIIYRCQLQNIDP
jgi:hypothetical protein